ncbi:Putative reduced growth phenotype protein [Septoria linicola]|uniref:Reduced growth phenotype protein n=1 Tax=Septoria linicola TaxID=215465 RepID=A0A9Q9EEC4_9PEZI|nr:putative reduced growth phenotype protein [Septoria linicola]USW47730.1 Putative reduced growth phenotype protein [Septoria linicola]
MPPTPHAPSNIRAYVQWKEPAVYAGEQIECIITFKNIARPAGAERNHTGQTHSLGNGGLHSRGQSFNPSRVHSRRSSLAQAKLPPTPLSRAPSASAASAKGTQGSRGHRPTLSLSVGNASTRPGNGLLSATPQTANTSTSASRPDKGHGRSLSIMSLGSETISEGRAPVLNNGAGKRPLKGHGRSASLQYTSSLGAQSPSPRQPSPLYEATTPPDEMSNSEQPLPVRPARRRPGTASAGNTPQLGRKSSLRKQTSAEKQDASAFNSFKFPMEPSPQISTHEAYGPRPKLARNPSTMHSSRRQRSPQPQDSWSATSLNPISRVMSETSQDGTPRSSSEIYSTSNHSDETLTSELPSQQQFGRLLPRLSHSRQPSRSPPNKPARPETLMMAYAQTVGRFTIDGSLINAAPFEEVKRKGVQGGGGVIGVERSKRSSGLFGALSWGNIGESLGGLLGNDEMSSMAQMKATVGSKTIPLLSTPQSLLFVELKLGPGEKKSYSYRFPLPRGLPPSHKGRAMKVTYHLSIGVQRPEGQVVKHVDIPFRVLGSYDSRGDTLGHDLMSPYILLQDAARTTSISTDSFSTSNITKFPSDTEPKNRKSPKQGLEDFLRYTERLLDTPVDANGVLLSPTSPTSPETSSLSRQSSVPDPAPTKIKEAIDLAILKSNRTGYDSSRIGGSQSNNRFNIARSGQPVAVLTMLRPAYRLGELVTGTIDFTRPASTSTTHGSTPTYSVLVELESSESIDASLALRSSSSISRVTRKVYAVSRENTLFSGQISFSLAIPSNAAPSFETTGVSLHWRLKVEFTAHRSIQGLGIGVTDGESLLLDQLGSDERGTTYIAKERLPADTFEIAVPLKVYGAVGIDGNSHESEALYV